MGQLTIRNVPDRVIRNVKIRAAQSGRSAEAELRDLLQRVYGGSDDDFWRQADELRLSVGDQGQDTLTLLREDRGRDG